MIDITYTVVLFVFILFNFVALATRKALISVLVGLVSFAIMAISVSDPISYPVLFYPYLNLLLMLVVLGCILSSINSARGD